MILLISILALILLCLPLAYPSSDAQVKTPTKDRIVIKIIQLDYADAEHLASVLAPLLSPKGRVLAYRPTNCLILRDKASIVEQLVEIIKGPIE
jgi:type II secretory pathway component GspD/PulD (secretin)